ncbi:class I SAM-dependent methyltransferase [Candidatus Bipolaricaulota bacterium]|nr:class I SAM-dependent methyltransferase [Candidatus Bipolaricaulota bacterium]
MTNRSTKPEFEPYQLQEQFDPGGFIEQRIRKIDEKFAQLNDRTHQDGTYSPSYLGQSNSKKLYDLLRQEKPGVVIETGVCNGLSTATILKALQDNQKGKLYSVDLPRTTESRSRSAVIPAGEKPGWAVPDDLKARWEFRKGNTIYRTPEILEELTREGQDIDIFLHDSEHSFEAMMIEFSLAWKHLVPGGFLLADNVNFSPAFDLFAEGKGLQKYSLGEMGLLRKST